LALLDSFFFVRFPPNWAVDFVCDLSSTLNLREQFTYLVRSKDVNRSDRLRGCDIGEQQDRVPP